MTTEERLALLCKFIPKTITQLPDSTRKKPEQQQDTFEMNKFETKLIQLFFFFVSRL